MGHSYIKMRVHLHWSTKYRRKSIDPAWRMALFQELASIAERARARLICAGGVQDHIHVLLEWSPAQPLSDIVRNMKTLSCNWVRNSVPGQENFGWQNGFTAYTVHVKDVHEVIQYLCRQERHHKDSSRIGGLVPGTDPITAAQSLGPWATSLGAE